MDRWGRWTSDGNYLVYRPKVGSPDPNYEIEVSELVHAGVATWLEHLESKSWISLEDLDDLARACTELMDRNLAGEGAIICAPEVLSSEEYHRVLSTEWKNLLEHGDPTDESVFQQFLEQHPILLPGPHGTPHGMYHGPLFDSVFSQPELPGFRAKRPDFLLFEQDSARIYAVLIEIEAPAKRWATRSGAPHSDLTRALDQLREWKSWFSEPHNVLAFRDLYKVDPESLDSRTLVQHFVLIHGRRAEATASKSFAKKRSTFATADEYLMTYDRLLPNGSAQFTVKLDRSGPDTRLRLLSIPPTFSLHRSNAERFLSFIGQEDAIRTQPLLTTERREFLLKRLKSAERFVHARRKNLDEIPWWEW